MDRDRAVKNKALSVCIVNYRTPQLVIDCLESFLPVLEDDTVVVIADNNSQDDSMVTIAAWLNVNDPEKKCLLVALSQNGGFSAGYNAAIKASPAQFYLLLNSDTIVRPEAIALLLVVAGRYPNAGLFGPRLEWLDGTFQESCFRDHSPWSELIAAARTRHVTALLQRYVVPLAVATPQLSPPWISFAAVLIRHEVLEHAGMLDEGFFLYFEDCEYCYRARKAGWDIVYVFDARIIHLHGQSSRIEQKITSAMRLPRYYYASRTRYFRLRYGVAGPTLANLGWCLGRLISKFRETFGSKKAHLPELAWKDIWINWKTPLAPKRHKD
ncbi:MAG TPA: glycosyltransferase family 2 protein [Aestuariivirga sp.]|nr:glycosyltransferase family 2 protein [Aestuariivirga sp.]